MNGSMNTKTFGWTIVSQSDQFCGGRPVVAEISCKKHLLRVRATGGIVCATSDEAYVVMGMFRDRHHVPNGFRKTFGREAYFKCRLHKRWLYKPTRAEKIFFDQEAIQAIMDV